VALLLNEKSEIKVTANIEGPVLDCYDYALKYS
jgi:hypothetical protein